MKQAEMLNNRAVRRCHQSRIEAQLVWRRTGERMIEAHCFAGADRRRTAQMQ
jgi:hypothetical protein